MQEKAQDSFDILLSTVDPNLGGVDLFHSNHTVSPLLSKKRGFLTPSENREINELINRFIYRVGGYWQDINVLNTWEYLIRQYSIHM